MYPVTKGFQSVARCHSHILDIYIKRGRPSKISIAAVAPYVIISGIKIGGLDVHKSGLMNFVDSRSSNSIV